MRSHEYRIGARADISAGSHQSPARSEALVQIRGQRYGPPSSASTRARTIGWPVRACSKHAASRLRVASSTLRSKFACFAVEMCNAHDQTVVRIAVLYGSGIRPNIIGLDYDDPHQAITAPARPLKVGNPLFAYTAQLPFEDWSVSRLIHYPIAKGFEFVFPHCHNDSF